ncbi:MAG: hypothetical protein LBN32_02180, partial [Helicobacteraceae bacterium]|nr:hypothetical protein [Helicobacteraceae bacterium]
MTKATIDNKSKIDREQGTFEYLIQHKRYRNIAETVPYDRIAAIPSAIKQPNVQSANRNATPKPHALNCASVAFTS